MSNIAVIELKTKQYIVEPGKLLKVDNIDENTEFNILYANINDSVYIGKPYVSDVGVELDLLETKKDRKIRVSRYKSKSRYRKEKSHRQTKSILKVIKIDNKVKNSINLKIEEESGEKGREADKSKDVKANKVEKVEKSSNSTKNVKESKDDKNQINIDTLDITPSIKEKLQEAGYNTLEDLKGAKRDDLLNIKGLGEKGVDKLLSQIK